MKKTVPLLTFLISCLSGVQAGVKLPAIFGDHMVLQQEASLPVWGTADAGEKVTVTVGTESAGVTADADGKWIVKLPPLPNGTAPTTLTVAGKNTLTFSDVLVGEVWLCTGQSNMEFNLSGAHNARDEVPKANDPQLRLFCVEHAPSIQPAADVARKPMDGSPNFIYGTWMVCTPQTAPWFTAVGYFFGRELRSTLNRPVGLVESCFGGTPAQAWTSLSALQQEPALKDYVDKYNVQLAAFPKAMETYPAQLAAYQTAFDKWKNEKFIPYQRVAIPAWSAAVDKAKAAGMPPPPRPPLTPQPPRPHDPNGGGSTPTVLFNGMIAPLIPYAIRGAIWYQGESNTAKAMEYRTLFPLMITDWRQRWGLGDFPFLFVELASYDDSAYPNQDWALLRESQVKTLSLANTAMASAVDIGDPTYIHPQDKVDVGLRLALAAMHVAYGRDLVYSGPIYDSMKVEATAIRISFTQTGGGLVIGQAPWVPASMKKNPVSTTDLESFTIAGADQNWVQAQAKIDGNTVVVSSSQVAQPVAVRYGWADAPRCNLYNKEGLPASPFRTDDWPAPVPAPTTAPPSPAPSPKP